MTCKSELTHLQKKHKYGRPQQEESDKQPDENDQLKDATTLYVGNLLVSLRLSLSCSLTPLQFILHH